jgi:hypothetical protein
MAVSASSTPVYKGSKEATFTTLTTDFGVDDRVRNLLLAGPMENLEDFRRYFTDEKDIDTFVAADTTLQGPEQRIQISRLRRAWAAVKGGNSLRGNTIPPGAGLDDLLEEASLKEIKAQFWGRYKAKRGRPVLVELNPSDQLLSRCYTEIDDRLLTVYDISRGEAPLHQVMFTKKRKRVGTDLYIVEDEAEVGHDVERYLAMLHTYLLALAIAGSNTLQVAPAEEAFESDVTKLAKVPWDVMQAYYFRASHAAMSVPEASRLAWLKRKDIAERAAWVSQFQEGNESLGQVVQSVMEWRKSHWDPPTHTLTSPDTVRSPIQQHQPKHQQWRKHKEQRKSHPEQTTQNLTTTIQASRSKTALSTINTTGDSRGAIHSKGMIMARHPPSSAAHTHRRQQRALIEPSVNHPPWRAFRRLTSHASNTSPTRPRSADMQMGRKERQPPRCRGSPSQNKSGNRSRSYWNIRDGAPRHCQQRGLAIAPNRISPFVKMAPGSVTSSLRSGTALCSDFNRGKCAVDGALYVYACAKGAHRCGRILQTGRPCAMNLHGAHNCQNP